MDEHSQETPVVREPGSTMISSWTVRFPWVGSNESEWLFRTENPACPVEFLSLRKDVIPEAPRQLFMTLVALPWDPETGDPLEQTTVQSFPFNLVQEQMPTGSLGRGAPALGSLGTPQLVK